MPSKIGVLNEKRCNKRQVDKEEVRDMVNEARIKDLHDSLENEKLFKNIDSPPRKGGKKRSRKQRKQRRRKTRRSV